MKHILQQRQRISLFAAIAHFVKEAKYKAFPDVLTILKPSIPHTSQQSITEEPMKKIYLALTFLSILGLLLTSCGGAPKAANDKLAEILARGTMVVSTDPAYPPNSQLVEGGKRAANTKCTSDQHTSSELTGFDIDTAVAIAKKLGVEACFVTPTWDLIEAGNWSNRWDISIGSMTVTPERMAKLYFTQAYYTTPAAFFVNIKNTTYTQPSDLSGKKIGACSACTYEFYLEGTLQIPGENINFIVKNAQFTGYGTDLDAIQDLALGDGTRLDAVLTAQPTGAGAIKNGLPIKQLGDPVYFEYLAGAVDKASTPDPIPFLKKVSEIIQGLNTDGTLLQLSQKYYSTDLTSAAATFDLAALKQWP
jgi:polar amino acid transport system substrate-binding protein